MGLQTSGLEGTCFKYKGGPTLWVSGLDAGQFRAGVGPEIGCEQTGGGEGLTVSLTARPGSGSAASELASSPTFLACGAAVRSKIASNGTGRGRNGI